VIKKMAQISSDCVSASECVEYEIKLEDLREQEEIREKGKVEQKSVKKEISKLIKKADINARYVENLRRIKLVKSQSTFKNYLVF
jgi:DNA-binding MarR family transcriptional regulator